MAITLAQRWYAGAAAASVAVLAVGYFLLVSPQQSSASDISAQAATVEQANVAAEKQVEALKAEYQDLPALQSQVAVIRTRLPQSLEEPTLLRTISALAKSSGVKLTSIGVQTPVAVAGGAAGAAVSQLPLSLDITGSFANTRLFLTGVESMQRSMLVTGINISRATAPGSGTADGIHTVIAARVFTASAPSTPTVGTTTAAAAGAATTATQPS
jgi:Tfp pilus assembly protein PilO